MYILRNEEEEEEQEEQEAQLHVARMADRTTP